MSDKERVADQMFEAAVLVEYANTGEKKSIPDLTMYKECAKELAYIANFIQQIRDKGFGADVYPNTHTR